MYASSPMVILPTIMAPAPMNTRLQMVGLPRSSPRPALPRVTFCSMVQGAPPPCRGRRPPRSCRADGPGLRQYRAYFPSGIRVGLDAGERRISFELPRETRALAVADLEAEPSARAQEARRIANQLHQDLDPIGAAVEGGLGLVPRNLGMHLLDLRRRDVRRIAAQEVAAPDEFRGLERLEQVAQAQLDALAQAGEIHVAPGDRDRLGREIGGQDARLRLVVGVREREIRAAGADIDDEQRAALARHAA